jgi:hypothetical protein
VEDITIAIQGCINKSHCLRENDNPAPYNSEPPLDYAWACDRLRPTPDRKCDHVFCCHDGANETLDILQREAYTGIRVSVLRVVNNRQPQELVETVFDWALTINGIPSDPRVIFVKELARRDHLGAPVTKVMPGEEHVCGYSTWGHDYGMQRHPCIGDE